MIAHYNEPIEQVLIGACLKNSDYVDVVESELVIEDFSLRHRNIVKVIFDIAASGDSLDLVTVAEELDGEFEYLTDLCTNTFGSNISGYCTIISSHSTNRKINALGVRLLDLSASEIAMEEKLKTINESTMQLERAKESDWLEVNEVLKATVADIDDCFRGNNQVGLELGFPDLDGKIPGGLQPGELMILAARPSMGKTALALNFMEHNLKKNIPILFFSVEMSEKAIMKRMLSSMGEIPLQRIKTGDLGESDWPRLEVGARYLKDKPFFINTESGISITKAQSVARKLNRMHDIGLIAVDYLQLMTAKGDNKTQEVGAISRGLKAMAKQCGCPVIALAQLNRGVESRPNKRPMNSDLRESGEIEQDADQILFIYRDEYYNEQTNEPGIAEIKISKQRDGETGTVRLGAELQKSRFVSLDGYVAPQPPSRGGLDL